MRKVLFSVFMIAMVAFAFTVPTQVNAQAPLLYTGEMGPDTVNASETITHYPNGTSFATARRFKDLGDMAIAVKLDSLSGTPNVKSYLDVSYDLAGTFWVPVDTVTSVLMGTTKTFQFDQFKTDDNLDDTFAPTWFRIRHVGTGTQAVKVQDIYCFKKRL